MYVVKISLLRGQLELFIGYTTHIINTIDVFDWEASKIVIMELAGANLEDIKQNTNSNKLSRKYIFRDVLN